MAPSPLPPPLRIDARRARIPCFEPATRASLGTVAVDPPEAVRAAVAAAREAQRHWRHTSFRTRRAVLRALVDDILDDADAICDDLCRDSGKTRENAMMGEVWPVCERLRWTSRHGERHLLPEPVSSGLLQHKRARIEYHPRGVVGAVLPWNYPLQNLMNPIGPALMSGNACVVKPSEAVAWSSARIVARVQDVLERCGQPRALVQAVQGYAETGRALIEGGIDALLFIGSVDNGRRVLQAAAEHLVPVVLELGGKDPLIVCDDADLSQAVHAALGGTFIHCGQNCVASERVLVHELVAAELERRVAEVARALRQGDSRAGAVVDVGAMTTPAQLERVERLVERAVAQGARLVCGGGRVLAERGDFFAPTVLADVTPDMDIMQEEVFGPVMLLCPVRDDAHAIAVANGTPFGLGASVFSRDHARANRVAAQLDAGMCAINDFGGMTYMVPDLPFGGVKASGFGRMGGRDGLRAYCYAKAVLDDRWPLRLPSKLFPVGPADYATMRGALRALYGSGGRRKVRGIGETIEAMLGAWRGR